MQRNENSPGSDLGFDFPKHGYRGDLFPDIVPSSFTGDKCKEMKTPPDLI